MVSKFFALTLFIITLPLYPLLFILIKNTSPWPFILLKKRIGKDKKVFTMYKFRTMVENADALKPKLQSRNEAYRPAFKIYNDPRYTKIGKLLARTAIDEIPQLINIIKGEMSFVGPRPLPVAEAEQIPDKYIARFSILPGLTSPWVVKGGHKITFEEWMKLDVKYTADKNIWYDIQIIFQTIITLAKVILQYA